MNFVTTVRGPVRGDELGITLTHEHLINDVRVWFTPTRSIGLEPDAFASAAVDERVLWELKHDPFGNRDNCALDSLDDTIEEVGYFARLGGQTIVDTTGFGIGRDLVGLRRISERTGIHIIAGTGLYLDRSHPEALRGLDLDALAQVIIDDVNTGVEGIRPGILGEVGVGLEFTAAEQISLRATCRAQRSTGLAMQVHLPAWGRLAHDVLDIAESEGVDPSRVVLCHMGPSGDDLMYQLSVARRAAWIQYDMIGMEVFYADQQAQCPSDNDNARWLQRLVDAGFIEQLLISQDVFVKSLQRRHGGPGYGHILQYFVPRLRRHGFTDEMVDQLLIVNPRHMLTNSPFAAE